MTNGYVIKTVHGYVGRISIDSGSRDDLPKAWAYVYDHAVALQLAEDWQGVVEPA